MFYSLLFFLVVSLCQHHRGWKYDKKVISLNYRIYQMGPKRRWRITTKVHKDKSKTKKIWKLQKSKMQTKIRSLMYPRYHSIIWLQQSSFGVSGHTKVLINSNISLGFISPATSPFTWEKLEFAAYGQAETRANLLATAQLHFLLNENCLQPTGNIYMLYIYISAVSINPVKMTLKP